MTLAGAMFHFIDHRDHRLMRRVNRWPAPRWIRIWMLCATRGGDGWLWYALGLTLLLFGGDERFMAVGAAALAAGLGVALFLRIKKATGRKRPCAVEPHCWATLLPPDQFSFPSGHTITAFAVAVSLSAFYPAEGYHQDYAVNNPDSMYIMVNDLPKLDHLRKQLPDLYVKKASN